MAAADPAPREGVPPATALSMPRQTSRNPETDNAKTNLALGRIRFRDSYNKLHNIELRDNVPLHQCSRSKGKSAPELQLNPRYHGFVILV